jgi:hypothetical protein
MDNLANEEPAVAELQARSGINSPKILNAPGPVAMANPH